MSFEQTVALANTKIPITREHTEEEEHRVVPQPTTLTEMQQNMEEEMERRRRDWEKDVERIGKDFFHLPEGTSMKAIASGEGDDKGNAVAVEVTPSRMPGRAVGTEIIDIANSKNLFQELADGRKIYCLRFDVRGFEPHEVNVRTEGMKLMVKAKHEEASASGGRNKSSKQFNRQMDLPEGVDGDQLEAHLSADGILSVEAPVDEEVYQAYLAKQAPPPVVPTPTIHTHTEYELAPSSRVTREIYSTGTPHSDRYIMASDLSTSPQRQKIILGSSPKMPVLGVSPDRYQRRVITTHNEELTPSNIETEFARVVKARTPPSSPRLTIGRYSSPLMVIVDGQRKMKLAVDIGTGYRPEEVSIKLNGQKLIVSAEHEETTPSGRKSSRNFSRQFELPEPIFTPTLRAMLSEDGRIVIGASGKDNTDHQAIIDSIMRDMPPEGKSCNIEM